MSHGPTEPSDGQQPDRPGASRAANGPVDRSVDRSSTAADRSARIAVTIFPLMVLAAGIAGFLAPEVTGVIAPAINPLLGVIMFGMGLSLRPQDFALVLRRPVPVLVGVVAQYTVMPLVGFGVAWALQLPPDLAAGVILVGCAPGGTASNVIAYLAKADTALSVTMTSVSTLLAPLVMPLLTLLLAGHYLPVDGPAMAMQILQIVLIPVLAGLVARLLLPRVVRAVLPALPWFSAIVIAIVVAGVVSRSAGSVVSAGVSALLAVVLHNLIGTGLGYGVARLLGQTPRVCRTVSLEVGMQNSGLAAVLAAQYFSPTAALPGAIFSIWHNLSGAVLAFVYRRAQDREDVRAREHADPAA